MYRLEGSSQAVSAAKLGPLGMDEFANWRPYDVAD
jgi:hypothetical protein